MLDIPRDIKLARNPNQTEQVTFIGKDEFGNPKEEVLFCTPEEKELISRFFINVSIFGSSYDH